LFKQFFLPEKFKQVDSKSDLDNSFSVRVVQNEYDYDVFITLSCENFKYITDMDFKDKGGQVFKPITSCLDQNHVLFKFTLNFIVLKKIDLKFVIYSHFNEIDSCVKIEKNKIKIGLSQKQVFIETMPLDLLYLYAVFYI
jgi:hypothetical protein